MAIPVGAFCGKIQNATTGSHHAALQTHWYRDDHRQRVGRWRENLNPQQQQAVTAAIQSMLGRLGYE